MADSAPSGGAAPATATPAPTSGAPAAATKGPPGAIGASDVKASKPAASTEKTEAEAKPWGDDDDKELFERLKRSPYKAKIKGQDRALDSKDAIQEIMRHAQRGVGADKVLAETKAEKEALAAEKAEIAKWKATKERAEKGDFNARREMGWVPKEELEQREAEWRQVPPEVRQIAEEREQLAQENAQLKAKFEAEQQERAQRQEATETAAARRVALNATHEAADLLGIDAKNAERFLPHVAGAIADLSAEGLEIGVDMPPELIAQRVKQRIGELDEAHFQHMPVSKQSAVAWAHMEKLPDAEMLTALPKGMAARISKAFAMSMRAQRTGVASAQPTNGTTPAAAPRRIDASSSTGAKDLSINPFNVWRR